MESVPSIDAPLIGAILAGGQSRRMGGGDKCLMDLGGRPVLAHVIDRLAPQVGRLVLNANGDPGRFADFGLPVVADTIAGFPGPLAGILAAMAWARDHAAGASAVTTAAGDTPFLPRDLVARLWAASAGGTRVAVARSGGRIHPVFGVFPIASAEKLESFIRSGRSFRVSDWVAASDAHEVDFDPSPESGLDPFFNINTPGDLVAAERALMA